MTNGKPISSNIHHRLLASIHRRDISCGKMMMNVFLFLVWWNLPLAFAFPTTRLAHFPAARTSASTTSSSSSSRSRSPHATRLWQDNNHGKHHAHQQQQEEPSSQCAMDRRQAVWQGISSAVMSAAATATPAHAEITAESNWPLWTALPVAPYARRKTIRRTIVARKVWTFEQLIGIYYVHVPIRMTVVAVQHYGTQEEDNKKQRGLVVYAPVAPTAECLRLLGELSDDYGPVRAIILPSVAVEHKVNAGPFARKFPAADFFLTDRQYSFPLPLPAAFLGLPPWAQPLPSSSHTRPILGPEFEHAVLTVQPGPGSMYQDVALFHKPSRTLMVCDAVLAVTPDPPDILTAEPEYTTALLFHARESKDDVNVPDTPENRRKGWRRIVLLFNFFFPGSGTGNLGPGPILQALRTPNNPYGWGGWKPFSWKDTEELDFARYSAGGKPTILPIIQIILARGPDQVKEWLNVVTQWDFTTVIPAHLDAPLKLKPAEFAAAFSFVEEGRNQVRFCDEDVAFLRAAEEGPLSFSVFDSPLGTLRGKDGKCGL